MSRPFNIGPSPVGWKSTKLRTILTRVKRLNNSDLPLLSVNLPVGVVPRKDNDGRPAPSIDLSSYQLVEPGDLVMNQLGKPHGALGVSSNRGIISPAYFVATIALSEDPRFIHYLLRTRLYISEYERRGKNMPPNQFDISWDQFREIEIEIPPIAKQKAIADYLDSETARIDALIEKKKQVATLIRRRTEILLANHLDKMVARYGEVPLKSVARLSVSNVDKKSYEGQIAVRLCNYTDVYYQRRISSKLDFMEATADFAQVQKLTLNKFDVLITKDSETPDDIAVPALVVDDLPGVVLGYHLALLRPFAILGNFLYWVILSRRCRDAFSLAASGVTRYGLRQDAITRVPIPAVPISEQISLTELFEKNIISGDTIVDLIERQIELLRERRQALITAAVTGELEIAGVAA